jgi:hypothetical protein
MIETDLALTKYRESISKCASDGVGRFSAMNIARRSVYSEFPEISEQSKGDFSPERAKFWGAANGIINEFYPSNIPPSKSPVQLGIEPSAHKSLLDIFREAATTGFIPREKYLKPFFSGNTVQQQVSKLRSEGWSCELTDYGWITTRVETEEERAAREAEKRRAAEIKELNAQISLITERLKQLSAK